MHETCFLISIPFAPRANTAYSIAFNQLKIKCSIKNFESGRPPTCLVCAWFYKNKNISPEIHISYEFIMPKLGIVVFFNFKIRTTRTPAPSEFFFFFAIRFFPHLIFVIVKTILYLLFIVSNVIKIQLLSHNLITVNSRLKKQQCVSHSFLFLSLSHPHTYTQSIHCKYF